MIKRCLGFVLVLLVFMTPGESMSKDATSQNAHSFSFTSIEGEAFPLSSLAGKVVMVVNTASHCGFTSQYADLQTLWQRYRGKGFVLLAVPSNDFGGQEPGTEAEIKEFCEVNFNVDFPLTGKAHIKGGDAHPFYRWAGNQFSMAAKPRWNFHKYLIGPDGKLVDWFSTPTSPLSARVIKAVEAVLPVATN